MMCLVLQVFSNKMGVLDKMKFWPDELQSKKKSHTKVLTVFEPCLKVPENANPSVDANISRSRSAVGMRWMVGESPKLPGFIFWAGGISAEDFMAIHQFVAKINLATGVLLPKSEGFIVLGPWMSEQSFIFHGNRSQSCWDISGPSMLPFIEAWKTYSQGQMLPSFTNTFIANHTR